MNVIQKENIVNVGDFRAFTRINYGKYKDLGIIGYFLKAVRKITELENGKDYSLSEKEIIEIIINETIALEKSNNLKIVIPIIEAVLEIVEMKTISPKPFSEKQSLESFQDVASAYKAYLTEQSSEA